MVASEMELRDVRENKHESWKLGPKGKHNKANTKKGSKTPPNNRPCLQMINFN